MGSKRNWFAKKARRSARALTRVLRGGEAFGFDLMVGGVTFACDFDDAALAEVEVRRWRDETGEFLEYAAPAGEPVFARGRSAFDVATLARGGLQPRFLVFSIRERLPDVHRLCALVIRARSASGESELTYQTGLRDPRPIIVGVADDIEHVDFILRLAGKGVIPRLTISVSALTEWDRVGDAAVRDALAAGLPSDEVDWIARMPELDGAPMVAGALAAQVAALAVRLRGSAAQLTLIGRQADDLRGAVPGPGLDDFIAKIEEAAGHAMHAEALVVSSRRSLHSRVAALAADPDADDAQFEGEGIRSNEAWRREIVAAALAMLAERGLVAALAQLWRNVDPAEYRRLLDALAEALHVSDPDLARRCLLLGLGFDPSERRLRHIAVRLFFWGQLEHAGDLVAGVAGLPDNRAVGELRLAVSLKHDLAGLLPARRERPAAPREGRIAYVASAALPEVISGYTARTQSLLSALVAGGERVTCYTRPGFPWDRDQATDRESDAPDHVRVGPIDYIHSRVPSVESDPAGYMINSANALIAHFRADPPAIVHAASNYRNALPALIAARAVGASFIYEVRGLWELTTASRLPGWEKTDRFAFEREMERFVVREADVVLTITEAVRQELLADLRDGAHAHVLSNGVDPEHFRPAPRDDALATDLGIGAGDIVLVYAGSLVGYEGLDDVIDAIGLLRRRGVPARLIVVGDGRSREALERRVAEARLGEWVRFVGRVAPGEVLAWLALADIVPVVRKRFRVCELVSPLKPFEAMAMEKVVIVSDLPALTEIVEDGVRGCICRPGDPADLAETVARLHADPAMRAAIGRAAREWVIAERSWTAHARQLAAIYAGIRARG